ncbi:uncharacterized protein BYT42DRAFT_571074 [Radiomyces spectabilis]|uniref:uncharacterized protein n=1 Tax=Radiomyces spectabilis TaxID=64574 RepID=UPI00221F280E|nr:uncharacterized protein BYT42DRAFT_571074 [Radiomyces spectabilis]KAI8377646.1 hypothetical protein BYT42DRAFT_571074 [Radiomyces spectabilis]
MFYTSKHAAKRERYRRDASIDQEHDQLIEAWSQQINQSTSSRSKRHYKGDDPMPIEDYNRFIWLRIVDRYLEQQWLDSQGMLQCALAWKSLDTLSIKEAAHTMNVLSLRLMQNTVDARQELLAALGEPTISMPSIKVEDSPQESESTLTPDAAAAAAYELEEVKEHADGYSMNASEEEDEVHAPIFLRHQQPDSPQSLNNDWGESSMGKLTSNVWKEMPPLPSERTSQEYPPSTRLQPLTPSPSSLNLSAWDLKKREREFAPDSTYDRMYQQGNDYLSPYEAASLEKHNRKSHLSIRSISSDGQESSSQVEPWQSWFANDRSNRNSNCCHLCRSPAPTKVYSRRTRGGNRSGGTLRETLDDEEIERDDDDDEHDATSEVYGHKKGAHRYYSNYFNENSQYLSRPASSRKTAGHVPRSESSITAFRPISKNLAPRCTLYRSRRSSVDSKESYVSSLLGWDPSARALQQDGDYPPGLTKSRSFPSKAYKLEKTPDPPPIPKERKLVQSIVSKKASISKLFASKKP